MFAVLKTGSGETKVALELVDHLDLEGQRNIPHGISEAPRKWPLPHRHVRSIEAWLQSHGGRSVASKESLHLGDLQNVETTPMWLGCGTCSQTNVVILTSFTVEDSR